MKKLDGKTLSLLNEKKPVAVDHRLGMTLFLFFIMMAISSFIPEETVALWLIINSICTIVFLGILYFLWTRYKHDSVRYYSLQIYVMLSGIVFFSISPLFKLLAGTGYFWILLIATLVSVIASHLLKKQTVKSFVNKQHKLLGTILSVHVMVLVAIGILLIGVMNRNETPENMGVALLFYFVSGVFIILAPMFLVREEDVEKLKT